MSPEDRFFPEFEYLMLDEDIGAHADFLKNVDKERTWYDHVYAIEYFTRRITYLILHHEKSTIRYRQDADNVLYTADIGHINVEMERCRDLIRYHEAHLNQKNTDVSVNLHSTSNGIAAAGIVVAGFVGIIANLDEAKEVFNYVADLMQSFL